VTTTLRIRDISCNKSFLGAVIPAFGAQGKCRKVPENGSVQDLACLCPLARVARKWVMPCDPAQARL